MLEDVTLKEEYIELYKMELRQVYNTLNTERSQNVEQCKAKISELDNKLERLEERFINEELKADLYYKHSEKLREERDELRKYLESTQFSTSNLEKYIERSLEYLLELPSVWASSGYAEKRKLQSLIFPEGFLYNKKIDQTRTTKLNSIFHLIASIKGNSEQEKTGTSEVKLKNSGWVASPRIELGSGASETLILSIVLRGRWSLNQSRRIGREYLHGNGEQNYAKKLSHRH